MKRSRNLSSQDISTSSMVSQRTAGWGPYSGYTPITSSAVTRLPPTESSFMTELGGNGVEQSADDGIRFQNNCGLNGCQRLIEDGFFDVNGIYTLTEENHFVQLVLYDFYKSSPESTEIALQPRTCFIDLGGAMKLALSKRGDSDATQIQYLLQELTYTINASFGIAWPRFCWWNSEIIAPASDWKKSVDNEFYYPQANPVDDNMGTTAAAMFIQSPSDATPIILCQIIGVSQLCFSINPNFQAEHPGHRYFMQLMTPRMSPMFTLGTYPAYPYLNPNLINGCNGWFRKAPYVFGFGFRSVSSVGNPDTVMGGCGDNSSMSTFLDGDGFVDIYGSALVTTPELDLIGNDFVTTTLLTDITPENEEIQINAACYARKLQKVVIANMPCTLTNSRYYVIRSPELSQNQILPFLTNVESGSAIAEDTLGILWNTIVNGNRPRDISGNYGINTITPACKEVNPMFNLTNYRLWLESEWSSVASVLSNNSNNMLLVQGEDLVSRLVKDNTVYFSNRIPSIYSLEQINGNAVDATLFSFPACYDSFLPSWKTKITNTDSQFDVQQVGRNRLLVRYLVTTEDPILPTSIPNVSIPIRYEPIVEQWSSAQMMAGLQKSAEKSVHFMRAVGF